MAKDKEPVEHGRLTFTFIYDDTGAVGTVEAGPGWKMQKLVDDGYVSVKEKPRPGDRIEFQGGPGYLTPELLELHVNEFVERGLAPDRRFHIASITGGANRGAPIAPIAPNLARANATRDFDRLSAHPEVENLGWKVAFDGDITVHVELLGRLEDGTAHPYRVRLVCDAYDPWPPDVTFVGALPEIAGFPEFGLHRRYNFGGGVHKQLVCFSLTKGYYETNHKPTELQRWKPGRHWLFAPLMVLHRALQAPYYRGTKS